MLQNLFAGFSRKRSIFVPASVVADDAAEYALVGSVVDWLNAVRDEGCYHAYEIAPEAPQAYNTDYYYAQVCNGGHSQFRHNSRMDPLTLSYAQAGLRAANLTELAACLDALVAAPDMGKDELDRLDKAFFAAFGDYHAKMNAWLKTHVRIVPDEVYKDRLAQFLKHDSVRAQRFRDKQAFKLQAMIENEALVGFAEASTAMGYTLRGVRPGKFATICNEQTVIWGIASQNTEHEMTLRGLHLANRYLVVPQMPQGRIDTEDGLVALFRSGSHVTLDRVRAAVSYAHKHCLGLTAALLLEEASGASAADVTAIFASRFDERPEKDDVVIICVRGRGHPYAVSVNERRVRLIDFETETIVAQRPNRVLASRVRELQSRHRLH